MHSSQQLHNSKLSSCSSYELSLRWATVADAKAIAALEIKSLAFEIRSDSHELLNEQDLAALWDLRLSTMATRVILAFVRGQHAKTTVCSDFDEIRHEAHHDAIKTQLSCLKVDAKEPWSDPSFDDEEAKAEHNSEIVCKTSEDSYCRQTDDYAELHLNKMPLKLKIRPQTASKSLHALTASVQNEISSKVTPSRTTTEELSRVPNNEEMLCGFIALADPVASGQITALYIHPSCMRHGIGTLLINTAAGLVALKQGHKLEVKVQMYNKGAKLFYETLHFRAYDVKSSNQKNLITMLKEF